MTPFTDTITFFYTRNMAATAHFYETVLGLPVVLNQDDCRIYRPSPDSYLGFCERGTTQNRDGVIFTFVTDDVDGWVEKLKAQGISFEHEPALNEKYQIYNCFLRDPNGYLLEIQRFLDPHWNNPS